MTSLDSANISVILLAGGKGVRFSSVAPKQFLLLNGKPIARHSFDLFISCPFIKQIVVVCEEAFAFVFSDDSKKVAFATPGKERQDSVYNGMQKIDPHCDLICIHDSARPLLEKKDLIHVLEEGRKYGAAVLGVRAKNTIKEVTANGFVKKTLERALLWEVQTPQIMMLDLLKKGFAKAKEQNLTVTDDVSLVECLGHRVKLVEGSYENEKITTEQDLSLAESILRKRPCTNTKHSSPTTAHPLEDGKCNQMPPPSKTS